MFFGFGEPDTRKRAKFTPEHERVLRETPVDEDGPGTVLRDFEAMLDFVGPPGVEAAGKHHMLPMTALAPLNARLARPVELKLKRPQLRSYPNLQGLQMLGRATGLLAVRGSGAKARLVVDESLLAHWRGLNPAERYFTLLDAMCFHADPQVIGEYGRGWLEGDGLLYRVLNVWQSVPAKRKTFPAPKSNTDLKYGRIDSDRYTVVLLDLFGFVRVEQGRAVEGYPWYLAAAQRLPFGEALFARLLDGPALLDLLDPQEAEVGDDDDDDDCEDDEEDEDDAADHNGEAAGSNGDVSAEAEVEEDDDDLSDEDEDEPAEPLGDPGVRFDRLRPLIGDYFPGWQKAYVIPGTEFRGGTFVFKVGLYREAWWRLAVPAGTTLDELSDTILRCARFDNDHLYSFSYKNRFGNEVEVMCPMGESASGLYTSELRVGDLPLEPGTSMRYTFDFGDNWEFDVKLERIDPPDPKREPPKAPKVLEKHGKPPKQYPDDDW